METWTRMGGLFALGLTFAGCGSADAAAPVPAAAVGAVPAVAPVAPPPAPAVTVASCESTSPSGRLCVEFNQSQYATMTAAGAAGLCT
ncbi:MAG: hypothetical protein J0L92_24145, partial [Deltaproteobacteria bacterium]|nr:hypothetical protein [Deltaproteobacteria bacterium]